MTVSSICIDGYNLSRPKGTGIATYGYNLLSGLRGIGLEGEVLYGTLTHPGGTDLINEGLIARNSESDATIDRVALYWRTVGTALGRTANPVRTTGQVIWPDNRRPDAARYWLSPSLYRFANRAFNKYQVGTPVRFSKRTREVAPTAMHWTAPMPVHAPGMPNIYTIHDLIPLRLPHTTTDDLETYLALCRRVVRRADHIAVVSETTRRDVIELLGVDEDRVTNTYQAVSMPAGAQAQADDAVAFDIEAAFDLPWKGYLLHFSAIEPKKNLARIVEAYLSSGATSPLVLVGNEGWMAEGETALLDQIAPGSAGDKRIRRYRYLSAGVLTALTRGARAVVFPSLYEGFGLPVLEAMALGAPVLTSTAGSLPEIAGDAALCVDPYDVAAIARGIRDLDFDEGLRAELTARGRRRANLFGADAYRDRLRALYRKVGVG